jgi:thiaminase
VHSKFVRNQKLTEQYNEETQPENLKYCQFTVQKWVEGNGAELFVALATCRPGCVHPWSYVHNSTMDVNMLMTTG